jgi:hypothetical protein
MLRLDNGLSRCSLDVDVLLELNMGNLEPGVSR